MTTWARWLVVALVVPAALAEAEVELDPLHDFAQVEPRCRSSHFGFFGDVTTVALGEKVVYRVGQGPWRTVRIDLKGAHSIARLPSGAWLINDTGNDQMLQLQDLEGLGSVVARSELGGFALFRPHDQIVDPETGYVYAVDGNSRLFRFRDLSGPIDVWTFPPGEMGYVRGMSWFDGRLHLADATRGEVHRIEDFDKRQMTTFRAPSVPPLQAQPVPDRNKGGGSLNATGLVLNDVEKAGEYYYGTNFFAPLHAQGGDPRPARIIRWKNWKDFERGRWEDLTRLLPDAGEPQIGYFMTRRGQSLFISIIHVGQPRSSEPAAYTCFIELDIRTGRERAVK